MTASETTSRAERHGSLIVVLILAAVPCLSFWEVFSGKLLLPLDWVYRDLEPWRRLASPGAVINSRIKDAFLDGYALDLVSARAARERRVALWNPHSGGGIPHLAAGFSRMLYPPFWIYAVAEPETARNAEILLHLFLAEIFAFLFLRRIGGSLEGAFLGAIVFGLTPSLLNRLEISFIFPSLVWLPLLLFFVEDIAVTARLRSVAGLAVATALQLLAGHYPDVFAHLLGASTYGAVRLLQISGPPGRLRRLFLCGAGAAFGISLAAPFLLPSLELIRESNRAVHTAAEIAATGMGLELIATLVSPWVERTLLYIGIAALVFVPAALVPRASVTPQRGFERWAPSGPALGLVAVGLLGIGIATGSPLLHLLYYLVPAMRGLAYTYTLVSLAAFSLALLAGAGLSRFLAGETRVPRLTTAGFAAPALLVWLGSVASGRGEWLSLFRLPGLMAVLAGLLVTVEAYRRGKMGRLATTAALSVLLSAELVSYARLFNPRVDSERLPPFPPFGSVEFLRKDPDLFRVASLVGNYDSPFWANTLGAYGIEDIGAYHSLLPRQVGAYMERVNRYSEGAKGKELLSSVDPSGNWLWLRSFRPSHLLGLWNVKYIILKAGAPNPDPDWLTLVYDGEVRLYRYSGFLPRAWLAEEATVLPEDGSVYTKLLDPRLDPRRTVLLTAEPACLSAAVPTAAGAGGATSVVEVADSSDEHLLLQISSPRTSYLVVSQTFDPGWKARIDGASAPVLKANLNFLAIPVPAGRHAVSLDYRPDSYRWGWITFAIAVASFALLLIGSKLRMGRLVGFTLPALAIVAPLSGLLGWRIDASDSTPPDCGQLQVAQRFLSRGNAVTASLRNGAMLALEAPPVTTWVVKTGPAGMLRLHAAAAGPGPAEIRVLGARSGEHRDLLETLTLGAAGGRWQGADVRITDDVIRLVIEASAGDHGPAPWIGHPLLFRPGSRQRSHIVLLPPQSPLSEWRRWAPQDHQRFRKILIQPVGAEADVSDFDIVYESADPSTLSQRVRNVVPELYRIATVLVILAPREGGSFVEESRLLEDELAVLGLASHVTLRAAGQEMGK